MYSLVALSFFTGIAHAQSTSPKRFYKQDYAIAPGAEGRDETQPSTGASFNKSAVGQPQQSARPQGSPHKGAPSSRKRRVIMSVYVNSTDKEHLQNVLREVFTLADEKFSFITVLNHIGDYRNVTPEIESELAKRKIQILAVSEPPPDLNVTASPAWIIQTQQGTNIAEGIIEIHSFFNEFGEYDPKRRNDPSLENIAGRF